jgi:phage-related protein
MRNTDVPKPMPKPLLFGASPFEGSRANDIIKLTARYDGDTYRCVYAAKFARAVYVLFVFQKKSHSGIATPQKDIVTVQARYAQAQADYLQQFGEDE